MCRAFLFLSIFMLAACADPISTDQAELRNIKPGNRLPKSRPTQFVTAFDRFCIAPPNNADREVLLRRADYVPTTRKRPGAMRVFLVDNGRPAIVVSDTLCSARALSRTGQTERLKAFITNRFPNAETLTPIGKNPNVEQLWAINTPKPILIATERGQSIDGYTTYAVTLFHP